MQYYKCANKKFKFKSEAIDYANWIFKISGIIISVEGVPYAKQ